MLLSLLLSLIFFALGILHFSWAFGVKIGFADSLPTTEQGQRVLNPKMPATLVVGMGLTAFGLFYLIASGLITFNLPAWLMKTGHWVIPAIFFLRAIGDFKYVGFFKRIKNTNFGKLDTRIFSPISLIISLLGLFINLI
jgi:hypothetical protein